MVFCGNAVKLREVRVNCTSETVIVVWMSGQELVVTL